jgi:UDP-4-keto-D-QuiNAc 4-reductase
MSTVLVTGATGFVGRALCKQLQRLGHRVCAVTRTIPFTGMHAIHSVQVDSVGPESDWRAALEGKDTVVHLAARVHVMRESTTDPLNEFRIVNVAGTERLATAAVAAGIRRLVYVSSIKVNGERTTTRPFSENDAPQPEDAYAQSKREAEDVLRRISVQSGLEVVIVRPPLVYGPGVKGNFLSLLRLVDLGLPLPLGRCQNRRSLVGLTNLVDLLAQCVTHPAAAGQIFLAADGEDLSTPELLRRVAQAFGKRARLLPVPTGLLQFAARLIGRTGIYERLCGSLQVDAGNARRVLGWAPPQTVDAELMRTVQWYLSQRHQ